MDGAELVKVAFRDDEEMTADEVVGALLSVEVPDEVAVSDLVAADEETAELVEGATVL